MPFLFMLKCSLQASQVWFSYGWAAAAVFDAVAALLLRSWSACSCAAHCGTSFRWKLLPGAQNHPVDMGVQ